MHRLVKNALGLRKNRVFARAESGALIIFKLYILMAMASIFEAIRTNAQTTKASYVVADVISRELGTITPKFMNSMKQTARYMTPAALGTSISITMVVPTGKTDKAYNTAWSEGPLALF